jgi:hypothetical protein
MTSEQKLASISSALPLYVSRLRKRKSPAGDPCGDEAAAASSSTTGLLLIVHCSSGCAPARTLGFTRKHASGRADAGAPVRGKGSVRRRGATTPRGRKRSRGLTASALFEAGRLAQLVGPRVPQTAQSDTLGYGEQRPPLLVRGATRARPAGHARRSGWWRWTARARVAMLASGLGSASIGRCVGVAARWAWR